jgi:hypothetical protein
VAKRSDSAAGSVELEIEQLFQLPLSEFTATRNALASRLKKDDDSDAAARVKALSKPSMSAWVANQLYWRHRKAFERLLSAGERFREAQAAQLSGRTADVRSPLEERREALGELTHLASGILRDAGHPASPDTMRRIMTTLEALSTYGKQAEGPQPGMLMTDVDPPGFEALAALVPHTGGRAGHKQSRVIPFSQPKAHPPKRKSPAAAERPEADTRAQRAEARAALREAERALTDARKTAERARAATEHAAARAKAIEKARAQMEARLEKLVTEAENARQETRRISAQADDATQAVADAERALTNAKAAVEEEG